MSSLSQESYYLQLHYARLPVRHNSCWPVDLFVNSRPNELELKLELSPTKSCVNNEHLSVGASIIVVFNVPSSLDNCEDSWQQWHQLPVISRNESENIPTCPGHYKILSTPGRGLVHVQLDRELGSSPAHSTRGFEGIEHWVSGNGWHIKMSSDKIWVTQMSPQKSQQNHIKICMNGHKVQAMPSS